MTLSKQGRGEIGKLVNEINRSDGDFAEGRARILEAHGEPGAEFFDKLHLSMTKRVPVKQEDEEEEDWRTPFWKKPEPRMTEHEKMTFTSRFIDGWDDDDLENTRIRLIGDGDIEGDYLSQRERLFKMLLDMTSGEWDDMIPSGNRELIDALGPDCDWGDAFRLWGPTGAIYFVRREKEKENSE